MDHNTEIQFLSLIKKLEQQFGEGLDLNAVMLIIGVQELGKGHKKYSKDEKINLMHIAICTVLEPYGFYKFSHLDDDGWPHFDKLKSIPLENQKEQEFLLKDAVLGYFQERDFI